jgi:hypothetical protein
MPGRLRSRGCISAKGSVSRGDVKTTGRRSEREPARSRWGRSHPYPSRTGVSRKKGIDLRDALQAFGTGRRVVVRRRDASRRPLAYRWELTVAQVEPGRSVSIR